MNGYIYNIETRRIAVKVDNVVKCNDTTVKGESSMATLGTGQYVITDMEFETGDILPTDITDKRSEIPILTE